MKLLPYETFTVETSLSMPQAVEKLRQNVEAVSDRSFTWFMFWKKYKTFEGTVGESDFNIARIARMKRPIALPILNGHFEPRDGGTTLVVNTKPHPRLPYYMLWGLGLVVLASTVGYWIDGIKGLAVGIPLTFGFLFFLYGCRIDFSNEVCRAITALEKIFAESSKL
jgi:hypothetical protein